MRERLASAVHNLLAHPLLVLLPRVGEWLHARTVPEDPDGRLLDQLALRVYRLEHVVDDVIERTAPSGCAAVSYALDGAHGISICQDVVTGMWSAWECGRQIVVDAPTAAACAREARAELWQENVGFAVGK